MIARHALSLRPKRRFPACPVCPLPASLTSTHGGPKYRQVWQVRPGWPAGSAIQLSGLPEELVKEAASSSHHRSAGRGQGQISKSRSTEMQMTPIWQEVPRSRARARRARGWVFRRVYPLAACAAASFSPPSCCCRTWTPRSCLRSDRAAGSPPRGLSPSQAVRGAACTTLCPTPSFSSPRRQTSLVHRGQV